MVDAVIVSTARTPIGKAYRGALNDTAGATMGGHAIAQALKRSGLEGGEIEDVVMGCAMQEGTTGLNVARRSLLVAGLPVTTAGTTIDRQCSSGMQSMALLANAIRNDGVKAGIAGGLESISLVQNDHRNTYKLRDEKLMEIKPDVYMPMIDTAEVVAKRYGISRERQDEYGLESQRRTAAAREAGRFDAEIAPIDVTMAVIVPPSRTGFTPASPSAVVSGRGPSSWASVTLRWLTSFVSLSITAVVTSIGAISASKRPASRAAAVRRWLSSPYSSCRSRLIP
jgi:acetyl-CoA C-acetyltransferase/acetyl-CoA acyltransferase